MFDVSQTEGKPLPEFARVQGDPGEHVARLQSWVEDQGITVERDHIAGGADGVSLGGSIVLRPGLTLAESLSVLSHEYAHEALHKTARRNETTKTVRETEAEAVAFVVSNAVGLEPGTASSDYIQLYNGSRETLEESIRHIRDCAAAILDGILVDDETPSQEVG